MSFSSISKQDRVEKILEQAFLRKRIPSAYLFVGPDREVKVNLAIEFTKLINCESGKKVCGSCGSCTKIDRRIHPDVLLVEPEGSSIKIDKIRELTIFSRYGPTSGKVKVVIVDVADYMTAEAQASFLKTLEEPVSNVLFILLTSREDRIPATVISRCQKIVFSESDKARSLTEEENKFFVQLMSEIKGSDEGKLVNLWNNPLDAETIKDTLDKFMVFLRQRAYSDAESGEDFLKAVKVVAECYRSVERKANLKLAVDVMFLNLKEVVNG
ncbi:ATP-binding protein [Candidatus Margulisiibacteriota bacterium]